MTKNPKNIAFDDFAVVDLFCGIGGLTHGFIKENFIVDAGIDFDQSCKYAYEKNNDTKFIYNDITQLSLRKLTSLYTKGKKKILIGCAPCQPFSKYNHTEKKSKHIEKSKWKLLYSFSALIQKLQPKIISMENVPQLVNFNNGKIFNDFISKLRRSGYHISWSIVNAQDYGVPQRRKRLILFGSKYGEIKLIDKTVTEKKYKTVRMAIGHLPPVEDGIVLSDDPLHRARKLTELNKKRIQATKEGGFWRDWDKDLWLDCHKNDIGKEYRSVYGRMNWDDVAPTMTTYCVGLSNGRFGHPEQDRAISLREAALLQSFPESYDLIDPEATFSSPKIARHIGNAVPVELGIVIAKTIKKHINEVGRIR